MFVNGFSLALYVIEGFLVLLPLVLYIVGYIVRRLHSKSGGKPSKKSTVQGLFQLTRHLALSGEDKPFIPNDDADLETRAKEKNTYKAGVLSPPPITSYVEF